MKTSFYFTAKAGPIFLIPLFLLLFLCGTYSQTSFTLTTGNTGNYMRYKPTTYFLQNDPNHLYPITRGYVNFGNTEIPQQMVHIQGGNILISQGDAKNPYCLNGSIFFGSTLTNRPSGEWGIEYETVVSGGGLNIWKPNPSNNPGNFYLFIKDNGNIGVGTSNPVSKLQVNGDVTIETLRNTGNKVLTTDATGMLKLVTPGIGYGDNMGNCEAGYNIKMSNYSILNGSLGDKSLERADGSTFNPGLRFSTDNSMILETGQSAKLALVSGSNIASSMWVASWTSGGYGLVLNGDNKTGGIYRDANNPTLAIGFNSTKVGIGVIPPAEGSYALYVAGGILATEVKVQLQTEWKDLVFLPDYKLRTIKEVEAFISENGHLPEIPNSETVKNEGINIGEMNSLLLQKIEELTLYIIQQQKQIDMLEEKVNQIPVTIRK